MITAPPPAPTAPDQLGSLIGDGVATVISGPIDQAMQAIWAGCAELLGQAFELVDKLSTFSISTTCDPRHSDTCGSLPHLWPILVSLSTLIALGMFFWQITVASVRGGRGMWHAATGTVGYGLALAITVTAVASLLGAADGMTSLLLSQGVHASSSFNDTYKQLPLGQQALQGIKPVILGVVGFFGLLPAALGYAVEMMFRQAAVTVLVATIPFTAAGLMARSTARWFWISARWILTAIILKPAFALVLVIGLTSVSDAQGVVGLLAGAAVLWVALFSPMALFRLLAFVDPATDTGAAFRDAASNLGSRFSSPAPAGAESANFSGAGAGGGSGTGDSAAGVSDLEQANTARFDGASTSATGGGNAPGISEGGMPPPPPAAHQTQPANQAASTSASEPTTPESSSSQAEPTSPAGQGNAPASGQDTDTQPAPHHPDPGTEPPDDPGGGYVGGGGTWGGDGGAWPPGPPPTNPHGGGGSAATPATQAAETSAVIV
jgi:hypothetical protein